MVQAYRLFDEVFRDLEIFIAMVDLNGTIVAINNKAKGLAGYITDDLVGKDFFSVFMSGEESPAVINGMRAAIREGNMPVHLIREIWTKGKDSHKIVCNGDALFDDGKVAGAIVYGIEVPDGAEAPRAGREDRLMLYNDLLSHDIKNYNQVALGYIEMARDKPASEGVYCMLDRAHDAIKRSNELVACVKKLIDIESGAPIDQLRENLMSIIERNVVSIRQAYPQRQIEVVINGNYCLTVNSCIIIDDVFYNVLDNAVRYDLHSKVRVDIEAKARADGFVDIRIMDRGPGIPDHMKQAVFMRNNKSAHGWGMGLSITRAIVERLGGSVSVSDRVNGDRSMGSVFTIRLPIIK